MNMWGGHVEEGCWSSVQSQFYHHTNSRDELNSERGYLSQCEEQ